MNPKRLEENQKSAAPSNADLLNFKIINWIGIVNQLAANLAQSILDDLHMTEFYTLNHFSHHPELGQTITEVARARQQNQPGVSKVVKKLLDRGYLVARANESDARSTVVFITDLGLEAHQKAIERLAPYLADAFAGISVSDKVKFLENLEQMKQWFDDHRAP